MEMGRAFRSPALPIMIKLNTLIEDIYNLFSEDSESKKSKDEIEKAAKKAGRNIAHILVSSLEERKEKRPSTLRLSNIGRPKRQLWYQLKETKGETTLKPNDYIKFLYGHILEEMVLFLAFAAGHRVTDQQKRVTIGGVVGHKDCKIDDVTVDVKSASSYAFKKFKEGTLADDDPFGYISQLSAYAKAGKESSAAFLAIDKQSGELALLPLHQMEFDDVETTIKNIRQSLENSEPPDRCYEDIPFGKSGNRQLSIGCRYCDYKSTCWSDSNNGKGLRTFNYASGPVYLTQTTTVPNVEEV
jgi:CRISPR/Cas system-associated exonuclease Cas4 (RecB family)